MVYEIEVTNQTTKEEIENILKENGIPCKIRSTFKDTFENLDKQREYDAYMAAG